MARRYIRRRSPQKPLTILQQRLVAENVGLVGFVAKRFLRSGLTLDELVSAGMVGLCHAAAKYDSARGTAFSTYAYRWIWQAIRQEILDRRLIHLPKQRPVGPGAEWDAAKKLKVTSLSDPGLGLEMDSDVPDPASTEPDDEIQGAERLAALRKAIAGLSPRHRVVIRALLDGASKSETAERLGCCRKWVYKLEGQALDALRSALGAPAREPAWSESLFGRA